MRDLACHPDIMALLVELYGRRPIPFQTLDFAHGTEQGLHADAIHFDSVPSGWMCGVWVALEDIHCSQGPLVVVPGSHRVAAETFARVYDGSAPFDMDSYEQALQRDLSHMQAEEVRATTGDVVIWQADLAHGGTSVIDAMATRWSQVTHYFFDGFTYVTPMLGRPDRGEVFLREPLVDISTGRGVRHRLDGGPAHVVRQPAGRARLLLEADPAPSLVQRAASGARRIVPCCRWPTGSMARESDGQVMARAIGSTS